MIDCRNENGLVQESTVLICIDPSRRFEENIHESSLLIVQRVFISKPFSERYIFAVFIFFHHLDVFPAGGDVGVVFFLMLSGFVMTYGYGARVLEEGLTGSVI